MGLSSVFISKSPGEVQTITSFCVEHGIYFHAEAFISFEATGIPIDPTSEIYVFGSKNAFDFFLAQKPESENKRFAVIGDATKKYIESKGYAVAFSGTEAGKPDLVAREFATWLNGRRASFFISDISKKSLATYLDPEQYEEFVVYKTVLHSKNLDRDFDLYAFTSPSNAEAFLKQNKIADGAIVVSWGESTTTALKKHQIKPTYTLGNSSLEELVLIMRDEL